MAAGVATIGCEQRWAPEARDLREQVPIVPAVSSRPPLVGPVRWMSCLQAPGRRRVASLLGV